MERKLQMQGRGLSPSTSAQLGSTQNARPHSEPVKQLCGRGVANRPTNTSCICQRPKKLVMCRMCGYTITGRARTPCAVHPNTIFLMDLDRCPRCLSYSFMFQEYSDSEEP